MSLYEAVIVVIAIIRIFIDVITRLLRRRKKDNE